MIEKTINTTAFLAGRWPLENHLPTLIFISGASSNSTFWKCQMEGLSGRFNTLAIDLPGHGRSPGKGEKKIEDYAAFVNAFIQEIQPPFPIPCGFSMGGAVALELFISHSHGLKGGVIINSGARLNILPLILRKIREKNKNGGNLEDLFAELAISRASDAVHMKQMVDASSNANTQVTMNDVHACNTFNARERLKTISLPVLVMTSEDDVLTPSQKGMYLAENIQGAKYIHIRDAGHFAPIEQPDAVNDAIREFVLDVVSEARAKIIDTPPSAAA